MSRKKTRDGKYSEDSIKGEMEEELMGREQKKEKRKLDGKGEVETKRHSDGRAWKRMDEEEGNTSRLLWNGREETDGWISSGNEGNRKYDRQK